MKPEELLQTLRDAGLQDGDIAALLDAVKGMLEPVKEEGAAPDENAEDARMAEVFGAL